MLCYDHQVQTEKLRPWVSLVLFSSTLSTRSSRATEVEVSLSRFPSCTGLSSHGNLDERTHYGATEMNWHVTGSPPQAFVCLKVSTAMVPILPSIRHGLSLSATSARTERHMSVYVNCLPLHLSRISRKKRIHG